jgi:hypothetical protein
MVAPPHTMIGYSELYSYSTKSPFGDDEEMKMCHLVICEVWFSMHAPLSVDALYQHILEDFSRSVHVVGLFVLGDSFSTCCLKFVHGLNSFPEPLDTAVNGCSPWASKEKRMGCTFAP